MLFWIRHRQFLAAVAAGDNRMRLPFEQEVELFEMMAW
jgi:hypothetical protein